MKMVKSREIIDSPSLRSPIINEDSRIKRKRRRKASRLVFSSFGTPLSGLPSREREEEERRVDWSSLLLELLEQVLPHLHLVDLLAFRGTCRQWRLASTIALPYSQPLTPTPWLLFYGAHQSPECFLYNPSAQTSYSIQLPELQDGATCIGSHGGWLLVLRTSGSVFFFNPFSGARIDLPNLPHGRTTITHVGISSSSPTSEDCTVYVVNPMEDEDMYQVEIHVCQRGNIGWTRYPSPEFQLGNLLSLQLHPEGLFFNYREGTLGFRFERSVFWSNRIPCWQREWNDVGQKEVELMRRQGMGMEVMDRLYSWTARCNTTFPWDTDIYTSGTFPGRLNGKPTWVGNTWGGFCMPGIGVKAVCVQPRFDKIGLSVW